MCGIVVYAGEAPAEVMAGPVAAAARAVAHRGPDDHGSLVYAARDGRGYRVDAAGVRTPIPIPDGAARHPVTVILSHRRLSIIDRSPAGHQPMMDMTGRHVVMLNGEIYNHLELRRDLEGHGHRFRSRSDTEVLLEAFAEWGPACLDRLNGMYAFAVLDLREGRLFLARDGFGMKPLFYARLPGGWAFASEIRALLEFPGVHRAADPGALFEYLDAGGGGYGESTMFAAVRTLPPAHSVLLDLGRLTEFRPARYWRLDRSPEPAPRSIADAAAALRERFIETVALHLRSDVPVGALLSGGLDSSSIVMAMREAGGQSLELHTFSYIAGQDAVSEEPWIDAVNAASRAVPHKIHLEPADWLADVDRVADAQGEPFGSIAVYAQYRLFAAARAAGVPVVLGGQGADEIMAGYRHQWAARLASMLRRGSLADAARFLRSAARRRGAHDAPTWRMGLRGLRLALPPRLAAAARVRGGFPEWIRQDWCRTHGLARGRPAPFEGSHVLRDSLRRGVETGLPILLRYEDRNSMANSVEGRLPFLSRGLAGFVQGLDEDHLVGTDASNKRVLREAMRGLVPNLVLDRRDRLGFSVPVRSWLTQVPRLAELLEAATRIPALEPAVLRRHIAALRSGAAPAGRDIFVVWRLAGVALWAERFDVGFD